MSEIPVDAKIAMQQFLAEQKAKEQQRALFKADNPKKVARFESLLKKPMTSKQLEGYARSQGFEARGGNGRHGVHLVNKNGYECPLVCHGGGRTIANGTQKALIRQIQQNTISR